MKDYMVKKWSAENALGQHDDDCEQRPGYYICHCSKRRREAEGYFDPPGDLVFDPSCPRCYQSVYHNGDAWECKECAVTWGSDGSGARFEDDFGDLKESVARWTHIQRLYDRRFPSL